ncbi:SEA domain [Trinorchestia longiramus]|nr:SEA domain [Trinorchestia longiramus]
MPVFCLFTGSKVVTGSFRITNHNFWSGFEDRTSEPYRTVAANIEAELDTLFNNSPWAHEYNGSEVVSLSPGSLMVRAHLRLKVPDVSAAQKLGSAFLRGLEKHHQHDWLGPYTVDVNSVQFAEILVDSPSSASTPEYPDTQRGRRPEYSSATRRPSVPKISVGWGQWGPWSACSPCSPQYDQIRTRQCRLESGHGLLVNSVEPCLQDSDSGSISGDMETRSCQCFSNEVQEEEELPLTTPIPSSPSTSSSTSSTTPSSILPPFRDPENTGQDSISHETSENEKERSSICGKCQPSEVCVALQDEPHPTCRPARDPTDPTGCGGLCAIDSEVCQALGSRAFNCHSASQCLDDEWRCADGLCIPVIKRCDGHMNCYDQSDEQNCPACRADQFQCGNNTSCLPLTAKCDGNMDCWDGADEINCTAAAYTDVLCSIYLTAGENDKSANDDAFELFPCRNGESCVPLLHFCDGFPDCSDSSDEPFGCSGKCQRHEFSCRNGRCIPRSGVCDGQESCGDGSDEQNCHRPVLAVPQGERTPLLNFTTHSRDQPRREKTVFPIPYSDYEDKIKSVLPLLYHPHRRFEYHVEASPQTMTKTQQFPDTRIQNPNQPQENDVSGSGIVHMAGSTFVSLIHSPTSSSLEINNSKIGNYSDILYESVNSEAQDGLDVIETSSNAQLQFDDDIDRSDSKMFHEISDIRPIPFTLSDGYDPSVKKSTTFSISQAMKSETIDTYGSTQDTLSPNVRASKTLSVDLDGKIAASNVASVPNPSVELDRGWHLTSQFMPSLEEFLKPDAGSFEDTGILHDESAVTNETSAAGVFGQKGVTVNKARSSM